MAGPLSEAPYQVTPASSSKKEKKKKSYSNAHADSDIAVRRKTAFLLNTLLVSPATDAAEPNTGTGTTGTTTTVHPNSHAALVVDPRAADTTPATLRALSAQGLLAVLVRELVAPTPYGPDGEEGDACDADLEEKLARCVCAYLLVVRD